MKTIALINFSSNVFAFGMRSIENYIRSLGHKVLTFYCATSTADNVTCLLRDSALVKLADKLKNCDVVGISIISIHSVNRVVQVCEYLKKTTNARIVLGGTPVILDPGYYLTIADYVCTGEGEKFFEYFLKTDDYSKVPNLGYRLNNGKVMLNGLAPLVDVNYLPIPAFDYKNTYCLTDDTLESLFENPEPLYSQCRKNGYRIFRTRGCLFKCSYCVNNRLNDAYDGLGQKLRVVESDRVIKEIEYAVETIPNINTIYFLDDDFTAQSTREFESFISRYQQMISLPIKFYSTLATFSDKKLEILLRNGVEIEYIRFGLQSGSKRINENFYKRRFDKNTILNKIESILSNNIHMHLDMILNNPYENEADWAENINFFAELGERIRNNKLDRNLIYLNRFSLMYYPGTELYDRAIDDKIIDKSYIQKKLLTTHYLNISFGIHNFLILFYYLCLTSRFKMIIKLIRKPIIIRYVNKISLFKYAAMLEMPLWLLTGIVKKIP
jgi:anaerobic magnesium-protoporphyrin IX monomethyl ester cyclase